MNNNGNWKFIMSTNDSMDRFVGKEVSIFTPKRFSDGHRVLYVTEPGKRDKWYFFTSTIVSVDRHEDFEAGIVTLDVRTHNSRYFFRKEA